MQAVSVPKVPKPGQAAHSACTNNKEGPKPGEHVRLFRMECDRNKGFYSEKRKLEASIALYFEWAGCIVPRDVLPPFRNIVARTERIVQRTLPCGPYFLRTNLFVGHGGAGGTARAGTPGTFFYLRGSCTHRARTVQSFDIFIVTGSVSPPSPPAQIYHVFVLGHPWYGCLLQSRKYGQN